MILDEIRQGFANLTEGSTAPLKHVPIGYPALVYRSSEGIGVAVELTAPVEITESFAGAKLFSNVTQLNGKQVRLLRLQCGRISLRNEFAVVCSQFVDPGVGGTARAELVNTPIEWWRRWRQLLGNAIREKKAHAVLGELLALERLLTLGSQPEWLGPASGSHDIETPSESYEVKSTISKYDSEIHVAGQFQLLSAGPKPLFLVHQRFEPSLTGESVDSVAARLVAAGMPSDQLEELLERVGLPKGASARAACFVHLESRQYSVDASFPRIVPASFIGGSLPKGILGLEYRVDLTTLPSVPF